VDSRGTVDETLVCASCHRAFTYWHAVVVKCRDVVPGGCAQEFPVMSHERRVTVRCASCGRTGWIDFESAAGPPPLKPFIPNFVIRDPETPGQTRNLDIDDYCLRCSLEYIEGMGSEADRARRVLARARSGAKVMLCHYAAMDPSLQLPRWVYGQSTFKADPSLPSPLKCVGTLAAWIRVGVPEVFARNRSIGLDELWFREQELFERFRTIAPLRHLAGKCVLFDQSWTNRLA
jgi:hypothetical protein